MNTAYIADDEPIFRKVIRQAAERQGWSAVECADGEALIDKVEDVEANDLLFLDLQMPNRDGIEVIWALSEAGAKAETFLMTGGIAANVETAEALASSLGLNIGGVLNKPIPLTDLMAIFTARRS